MTWVDIKMLPRLPLQPLQQQQRWPPSSPFVTAKDAVRDQQREAWIRD